MLLRPRGTAFRPRAEEAGGDEETGLPEGRKEKEGW